MEEPLMSPLKKKKKLEVNFPRKVLLHRRNRLARKTRELNETKVKITADEIVITKKISQHLCNHLAQKVKQLNETANEILLTKMIPQHPRDRLIKVKELNDEFSFIKEAPQHSRDRLSGKVKELKKTADKVLWRK